MKVFISSPYTLGDTEDNVHRQMVEADRLITLGHYPFVPLYYHFQNKQFPRGYEEWMDQTLNWLAACDCVIRLPGKSAGADREVEWAESCGIPVFYDLEELQLYQKNIK